MLEAGALTVCVTVTPAIPLHCGRNGSRTARIVWVPWERSDVVAVTELWSTVGPSGSRGSTSRMEAPSKKVTKPTGPGGVSVPVLTKNRNDTGEPSGDGLGVAVTKHCGGLGSPMACADDGAASIADTATSVVPTTTARRRLANRPEPLRARMSSSNKRPRCEQSAPRAWPRQAAVWFCPYWSSANAGAARTMPRSTRVSPCTPVQ